MSGFKSPDKLPAIDGKQTFTAMDKGITDSDVESVTKPINGGLNHIVARKKYTKRIKE